MSSQNHGGCVATPERQLSEARPRRQPRYHVILWDDNDHTYDYVIRMMRELFGHGLQQGFNIASDVDRSGRAICLTTTREHAELKRDRAKRLGSSKLRVTGRVTLVLQPVRQIHAFGRDVAIGRCAGAMQATIEPAE